MKNLKPNWQYDPEVLVSYGLWECPTCEVKFYGGGEALHELSCPETGYDECIFHFGPEHVAEVKRVAEKYNENQPWYGITLADLRKHFPELT